MKAVAIYARNSSTTPKLIEHQLHNAHQACSQRGWTVVKRYVDDAASGVSALERLLLDGEHGEFEIVVCTDLTRLNRHAATDDEVTPIDQLKKRGISIIPTK